MLVAYVNSTFWTRKKRVKVRSRCVADLGAKKKHLHRCKCLISLSLMVGRAGVEPTTNGLKVRCSTN